MSRVWRKHEGGGLPSDVIGAVDVEFRDGGLGVYPDAESLGGWEHDGSGHDVIAFRVRPAEPGPDGGPRKTDAVLLRQAVVCAGYNRKQQPRWCAVMDAFAVGSTYANELCTRYGLAPDELVGDAPDDDGDEEDDE